MSDITLKQRACFVIFVIHIFYFRYNLVHLAGLKAFSLSLNAQICYGVNTCDSVLDIFDDFRLQVPECTNGGFPTGRVLNSSNTKMFCKSVPALVDIIKFPFVEIRMSVQGEKISGDMLIKI